MSAIIVSAFPGMGKTYAYNLFNKKIKVMDSDSSHFDKDNFPSNYIQHIKENIPNYDLIFISSHKEVRDLLEIEGIDFDLFYPNKERRNEFIENYVARHSKMEFVRKVDQNWDDWIDGIENDDNPHCHKHCLNHKFEFIGNNPMILQYVNQVKLNSETKEVNDDEIKKDNETDTVSNFSNDDLNILEKLRMDMKNASIVNDENNPTEIGFNNLIISNIEFDVLAKTINFLKNKMNYE